MSEYAFSRLLGELAQKCQYRLTEHDIKMFDSYLSAYGHEAICRALATLLAQDDRRPKGSFISVYELERLIKNEEGASDRSNANLVAQKLIQTIAGEGRYWFSKFDSAEGFALGLKEKCGELAFEVVNALGGWAALCERSDNADMGVFTAQLRETALAVLDRARRGTLRENPKLPTPNPEVAQKIMQLAGAVGLENKLHGKKIADKGQGGGT